jgi:hypothetical protein
VFDVHRRVLLSLYRSDDAIAVYVLLFLNRNRQHSNLIDTIPTNGAYS